LPRWLGGREKLVHKMCCRWKLRKRSKDRAAFGIAAGALHALHLREHLMASERPRRCRGCRVLRRVCPWGIQGLAGPLGRAPGRCPGRNWGRSPRRRAAARRRRADRTAFGITEEHHHEEKVPAFQADRSRGQRDARPQEWRGCRLRPRHLGPVETTRQVSHGPTTVRRDATRRPSVRQASVR
jgi:hypothetical protein